MFAKMIAEKLDRWVHQRHGAHLASLAEQPGLCRSVQPHVTDGEVDQFLDAGTGVVEHAQQHGISAPVAAVQVRLCQDRGEVFFGQVADELAWLATQRDRQDLLALQQVLWCFRLNVAEERMQDCEPVVLRADRYLAVVFEMVEECLDHRDVDLLDTQSFQRDPALVAAEPKEQREGIAVGTD